MSIIITFVHPIIVMIEIKSTNYSVFISNTITKNINSFLNANKNKYSKLFILVDENSLQYCCPSLVAEIQHFEKAEIIEIESGEHNKVIEICTQLWSSLSDLGADRKSLLINIGGGVICDIGGFVASTFKRGFDFINIPTTLLSQVDASVGGKVGIDLNNIKNEIGVFSNPKAVFINIAFLNTLDSRQIKSGFAEMIKHALIADKKYWKVLLNANFTDVDAFEKLVIKSIKIKNKIVKEDFYEQGNRKKLNFGHTLGHAIETCFLENHNKNYLLHGEAIAIGMICEAFISNKTGLLPEQELKEITKYIHSNFKSSSIDKKKMQRIGELIHHDKKNSNGEFNFSLLTSIGECETNKKISPDLIMESLLFYSKQIKI